MKREGRRRMKKNKTNKWNNRKEFGFSLLFCVLFWRNGEGRKCFQTFFYMLNKKRVLKDNNTCYEPCLINR
jgi:hypothetical protein